MGTLDSTHEVLQRDEEVVGPSNRSFGIVFMVVFAVAGTIPLWRGDAVRAWALVVATLFGTTALVAPWLLTPLNRLWLKVGLVLHRVVNPLVMGILFYVAVTPFGLVTQLRGQGLLRRLRPDPSASTYWISRAGQPPSKMDRQF